ncbi:MAG: hypothetical protein ACFB02_02940 [Mastigocoleus sp.]
MSTSSISSQKSAKIRLTELSKPPYKIDQQVKFMYLEAEVDCLLKELQYIKTQRLAESATQQ